MPRIAARAGFLERAIRGCEHLVPRLGDRRSVRERVFQLRDVRIGVGEVRMEAAALQWIRSGLGGTHRRREKTKRRVRRDRWRGAKAKTENSWGKGCDRETRTTRMIVM